VNVNAPLFTESPSVESTLIDNAFVKVRAVVELLDRAPPANVIVPVPNELFCPARTVPADNRTPPVFVFAPDKTNTPVPNFSNNVDPDTAPDTVNTFDPVTSSFPPPLPNAIARPAPKSTDAAVLCKVPPP
jgi:hypothetical protein